jgi:hypothetical protein
MAVEGEDEFFLDRKIYLRKATINRSQNYFKNPSSTST